MTDGSAAAVAPAPPAPLPPAPPPPLAGRARLAAAVAGVTVFVGAFLLFQIQPMIGKAILPWFGGSPGVWTTCMLVFQALLLAGYAWAHGLVSRVPAGKQRIVHAALIVAALATLSVYPHESWKPAGTDDPILRILGLLVVTIGLPFLLLAATAPLSQAWLVRARPGPPPWWLYALSNAGSMIALLTYPFVFEPAFGVHRQTELWSLVFVVWCGALVALGLLTWPRTRSQSNDQASRGCQPPEESAASATGQTGEFAESQPAPPPGADAPGSPGGPAHSPTHSPGGFNHQFRYWLALSAIGSVLLLAVTNRICADISVTPFLWVLPLCIYLLSFVICFGRRHSLPREPMLVAALVALIGAWVLLDAGVNASLAVQIGGWSVVLAVLVTAVHNELHAMRPAAERLTSYYLAISIGGALGGLAVAVVLPLASNHFIEMYLAPPLAVLLLLMAAWHHPASNLRGGLGILWWISLVPGLVLVTLMLLAANTADRGGTVAADRNFFGTLRVTEAYIDDPWLHVMVLSHGQINHGEQFLHANRRAQPVSYYMPGSGAHFALHTLRPDRPMRVGVVGLGAGCVAAFARGGDTFRFYEINPAVPRLAEQHFTYLADARQRGAGVPVILGDGRLSLDQEPPQQFDVLLLDAFAGDAVPVHLLTREAAAIWIRHLRDDGLLVVNITNRHIDLRPVVRAIAARHNLHGVTVDRNGSAAPGDSPSRFALLARDPARLADERLAHLAKPLSGGADPSLEWTDDWSNLFAILSDE